MKSAALTERDRRALKAGAIVATMVLGWVLLVRPLLAVNPDAAKGPDTAAALAEDLGILQEGERIGAVARDIGSLESLVGQLGIDEADVNLAIRDLEAHVAAAAANRGVIIEAIRNGRADTTQAGILILRVDVSARAEFHALVAFLQDLEHDMPWVGASELSLTAVASSSDAETEGFSADPLLIMEVALLAVSVARPKPNRPENAWS